MPLLEHLGTETIDEPCLHVIPDIEVMRYGNCPRCQAPAREKGRVILQGHGCRTRQLVLPARSDAECARLVEIVVRRFRCIRCTGTCTTLPPGVLSCYLYSLFSILFAWLEALCAPLGTGHPESKVYAHQGVDRFTPERHRSGQPRWRSLARWSRSLEVL